MQLRWILLSCLIPLTFSCKKESEISTIKKGSISGYVQKGPFVNGTTVQMYELNSSLEQTGKSFSTQITDNRGTFSIRNIALSSQYVEFFATGYYFNEFSGSVSPSTLSLYALSDIRDINTVNVNILTHLERNRVKYLISNGLDFSSAKDSAQKEILRIFGINETMEKSENLDISKNSDQNAILLAISLILQGSRSAGELTELLADLNADLEQDGIIADPNKINKLRLSAINLNAADILTKLQNRYHDLGIDSSIPNFSKYLNSFLSFTGYAPSISSSSLSISNLNTSGATITGSVAANDLSTSVSLEYGPTTTYGLTMLASPSSVTGHTSTPISVVLNSLNPGTLYHFRLVTINSKGTTYSNDQTFTTLGLAPTASTQTPLFLNGTSVKLNGVVNANDLPTSVTFEYGTTSSYGNTLEVPNQISGHVNTNVNSVLTNLIVNTEYHYRIKAVNPLGIAYGTDMLFRTQPDQITDYEGHVYKIVFIGTQAWMAENLKATKLNDGTDIPLVSDQSSWAGLNSPGMCWYNNDISYSSTYGALYNWYTANTGKLCPQGWHVPSHSEWMTLINFVGENTGKLKEQGTTHWLSPNTGATDEFGFAGLPGGFRFYSTSYIPPFAAMGQLGRWWSSDHYYNDFHYDSTTFSYFIYEDHLGLSVRCIKD